MREILFRGKRTNNGNWVEGFPFVRKDTQGETIDQFIVVDAYEQITSGQRYVRSNLNQECFRVYPETISQFTGLTDKNGTNIFEGDVISYIMPSGASATGIVNFRQYGSGGTCNVGFNINWINRYDTGWLRNDLGFWARFREIEVIGNIHDNPELLEG